jgi:hypothetical protein
MGSNRLLRITAIILNREAGAVAETPKFPGRLGRNEIWGRNPHLQGLMNATSTELLK